MAELTVNIINDLLTKYPHNGDFFVQVLNAKLMPSLGGNARLLVSDGYHSALVQLSRVYRKLVRNEDIRYCTVIRVMQFKYEEGEDNGKYPMIIFNKIKVEKQLCGTGKGAKGSIIGDPADPAVSLAQAEIMTRNDVWIPTVAQIKEFHQNRLKDENPAALVCPVCPESCKDDCAWENTDWAEVIKRTPAEIKKYCSIPETVECFRCGKVRTDEDEKKSPEVERRFRRCHMCMDEKVDPIRIYCSFVCQWKAMAKHMEDHKRWNQDETKKSAELDLD